MPWLLPVLLYVWQDKTLGDMVLVGDTDEMRSEVSLAWLGHSLPSCLS